MTADAHDRTSVNEAVVETRSGPVRATSRRRLATPTAEPGSPSRPGGEASTVTGTERLDRADPQVSGQARRTPRRVAHRRGA